MSFIYILSFIILISSFLLLKRENKKLSIIREIIYSFCLFTCYNTFIVYINYLFNIKGSLLLFSIINFGVSVFLFIISLFRKKIQKYYFSFKESIFFFCIILILAMIVGFRSDFGSAIRYAASYDAPVHFIEAKRFSRELSLLDENNSQDVVYKNFDRAIPISYIQGGLVIKVLSNLEDYQAFLIYDGLCYIICSMLFVCTLFKIFESRKYNYLYLLVLSFLYSLAFALDSYLFGFCYLGLGAMVVNLLILTVLKFNGDWQREVYFKILILFLISFGVFFSYYLFFPCVYLSLGVYYIYLFKGREITFKELLLYGGITLIIPFCLGISHFIYPLFVKGDMGIMDAIKLPGGCYDSIISVYALVLFVCYIIWNRKTKYFENAFLNFCLLFFTGYIGLFFVLFVLRLSGLYYFYKLFNLYFILVILYLGVNFYKYRKYIYGVFLLIVISMLFTIIKSDDRLLKFGIYNYNANLMRNNKSYVNNLEVDLMVQAKKYKDICVNNNKFLIIADSKKNGWFYGITGNVPTLDMVLGINVRFDNFIKLEEYDCVVYFYEGGSFATTSMFKTLYENDAGIILKKNF